MKKLFSLSLLTGSALLTACVTTGTTASADNNAVEVETVVAADTVVSGNSLPAVAFIEPEIADESDDAVQQLVRKASKMVHSNPEEARKLYIKALSLVKSGQAIDEYGYLWTRYGLMKSSFAPGSGDFTIGTQADYMKLAEQTLNFAQKSADWHYTELGAFKRENYRVAGNGLAWNQMKLAKSKKDLLTALDNVEYAVENIESPEHYYILDTKVRILLKLKRDNEAFAIVKEVLDEVPDFGDFQDFKTNKAYKQWLAKQ